MQHILRWESVWLSRWYAVALCGVAAAKTDWGGWVRNWLVLYGQSVSSGAPIWARTFMPVRSVLPESWFTVPSMLRPFQYPKSRDGVYEGFPSIRRRYS